MAAWHGGARFFRKGPVQGGPLGRLCRPLRGKNVVAAERVDGETITALVDEHFDLRPGACREYLQLRRRYFKRPPRTGTSAARTHQPGAGAARGGRARGRIGWGYRRRLRAWTATATTPRTGATARLASATPAAVRDRAAGPDVPAGERRRARTRPPTGAPPPPIAGRRPQNAQRTATIKWSSPRPRLRLVSDEDDA